MEISLIRHGKSTYIQNQRITCDQLACWIKNYDKNGVIKYENPPKLATEKIAAAKVVLTSHLARSIESAKFINPAVHTLADQLFRETELPVPQSKFSGIKLKAGTWAVLFRFLWFMGYSRNCESYKKARLRAEKAALQLIHLANNHESIVLVGHGFFNLLIAKELVKMGWVGKKRTSSKHWSCTTYLFKN